MYTYKGVVDTSSRVKTNILGISLDLLPVKRQFRKLHSPKETLDRNMYLILEFADHK